MNFIINIFFASIKKNCGNILMLSGLTCASIFQLDNHRNQLIQVLYSSYLVCSFTVLCWFHFYIFPCLMLPLCLLNLEQLFLAYVLFSSQFVVQLELFLSSGTVSLSIYSLVGAIFGMNIPYTWNDGYGYMFKWVRTVFPPVILASMTVICG